MTDAQWNLDISPSAAEAYEAMIGSAGAAHGKGARAIGIANLVFTAVFAPLGATLVFWTVGGLFGGASIAALPTATLSVTFFIFAALAIWLSRQTFYIVTNMAVGSTFGPAYQVNITEQGLSIVTGQSRWQSGWGDVAAVCGTKNTIAVVISDIVIAVPRRAFLGPLDAKDALDTMQNWQRAAQ
ncbi:MAG: YcxB family protein [Sulfitobacter sp.]